MDAKFEFRSQLLDFTPHDTIEVIIPDDFQMRLIIDINLDGRADPGEAGQIAHHLYHREREEVAA